VRERILILGATIAAVLLNPTTAIYGQAEPDCCLRTVGTIVQVTYTGTEEGGSFSAGALENTVDSQHLSPALCDCPLRVDFLSIEGVAELRKLVEAISATMGVPPEHVDPLSDFDYLLKGTANRDSTTGVYTLTLSLVDHVHGQVVRKGQTSWHLSKDESLAESLEKVRDLSRRFRPLDDVLHQYEGKPVSARLKPEEEVIGTGQEMQISLSQIRDSYRKAAKPWQYVVVQVEKGELTNGIIQFESYRFHVGDGQVTLAYKAPDECKDQTETITVYNSCQSEPLPAGNIVPEDKIASTQFKIRCIRGTFDFLWKGTTEGRAGGITIVNKYAESGKVPFKVKWKEGVGTFEAKEEVRGEFSVTSPKFSYREEYTATHVLKGEVQAAETDSPQLKVYWERHVSGEEIPQCEMVFALRDGEKSEFPVHRSGAGWTHESMYTVTQRLDSPAGSK
jgi:hypothetical protein